MKPIIRNTLVSAVLLMMTFLWMNAPVYAAAPSFTASQKAAFDRMVLAAGKPWAAKLTQQHKDFEAMKQASADWEQKFADLHYRSEETTILLRKRIKLIDADKLAKLQQTSGSTKEQYRKLFDLYRSVNLQLETARKLKNKTLTEMLRLQADGLKIAVQLARQDIRAKDAAYQAARKNALAKMKKVRDTLSLMNPVEVQIRAAKSALSGPKDSRLTVWKSFTRSLSGRDAKTASVLLGSVNELSKQIVERLQKIHELESRIAGIIRSAEAQLSASGA